VHDPERHVYHAMLGECAPEAALVGTDLAHLHLLASGPDLVGAEIELVSHEHRETRLREALAPLLSRYDFVVIDSPPSLGLLTLNGLVAADSVLIPMQCEYYALEGLARLLDTVERVRAINPALALEGIVLTMVDPRANLTKQVTAEVRTHFGDAVFQATIPRNVRLSEAPSHGKPILLYDIQSKGAIAYLRLAEELLERRPETRPPRKPPLLPVSAHAAAPEPAAPDAASASSAIATAGAPSTPESAPSTEAVPSSTDPDGVSIPSDPRQEIR
jgi:chromosome partitioning protein